MANWAYVENNEIKGRYDSLPKSWKNISGFDLCKDDLPLLKSLSWYPVTKQHDTFDDTLYNISEYEYTLREDDVLETVVLQEKINYAMPKGDIPKEEFFYQLRIERNKKLTESDWTQLTDIQNMLNDETKNKWLVYRQNLRDITEVYIDNDIVDINQVVWPQIPQNVI
jgi:hypothetical protein